MRMKNQSRKRFLKSITKHGQLFIRLLHYKNKFKKIANKRLNPEIYRYLQKKAQNNINNELKELKLGKLVNKNISESDMVNIKRLNACPIKNLQQIAKLRNINNNMSKRDIIYALIHSEPIINEKKYIIDSNNEIRSKINDIRLQLFNVSPYLNKKERGNIRKRLYGIQKMTKINRSLKNKLLKELNSISSDLKFKRKNMVSDCRDENYANIDDIEYMFRDIDNHYAPILTSSLFNKGYQRYHFRGDKLRNMSVKSYLDKIIPYLRVLIYENKAYEQKIQINIGFNMTHISDNRRITHFSRSGNVICMPSSNTNEILGQLLTLLLQKFQDDLQLSRESSSFVYESVGECNIHFDRLDLRRGALFIDTPEWLKPKKATINPQNVNNYIVSCMRLLLHCIILS